MFQIFHSGPVEMVALSGLELMVERRDLVAMLQHAFDPPPDHLAVPSAYLGGLASGRLGGATLATTLAAARLRRLPLGAILREQ